MRKIMKKDVQHLFNKLAAAEQDFLKREFLSPVLRGNPVRVRIEGVVMTLKIKPHGFQGWGIFRPTAHDAAQFIRHPNLPEKDLYLNLFPRIRLIVTRRIVDQWIGILASQADSRFRISGTVPISLAEEIQVFDTVDTRFDGNHFWFDKVDQRRDPRTANYLRESLVSLLEPAKLDFLGLSLEERDAYVMAYGPALEADIEAKRDKTEDRLKAALCHAGARLQNYRERDDTFTIEYTVDGDRHTSVLNKADLTIQSAGICLSGGDRAFDLQSLVGVIREGRRGRRIVRVGLSAQEQDWYRRAHPPE
jgi:hypothetical protein